MKSFTDQHEMMEKQCAQLFEKWMEATINLCMVFGYFWQNAEEMNLWDQVYIVLDEGKSKLIAQAVFDKDCTILDPYVLIIDSDDSNWVVEEDGFGVIDFLAGHNILEQIRNETVSHSILNRCIKEDAKATKSMELLIKDEKSIRDFRTISYGLHDAYIKTVHFEDGRLVVTFDGIWGCQIKVIFSENLSFNLPLHLDYPEYWLQSSILQDEERNFYLINDRLEDFQQVTDEHTWMRANKISYQVIPKPMKTKESLSENYHNGKFFPPDEKVRLATVEFTEDGDGYTYLVEGDDIFAGDYVRVPVGKNLTEKIAFVTQIYSALPEDITYPWDKLKTIIGKYSLFDEETAQETVSNLLNGQILDLRNKGTELNSEIEYDLLRTPLGDFWLELNEVPIPMKIFPVKYMDKKYTVDYGVYIKPSMFPKKNFLHLKLCADFDMDAARWIDELSDENVWGSSGVKDGIHFGITGEESPEFEDEIVVEKYSHIPFYGAWHREWQQKYGFNLAWKNYECDDDLSIDFATT